MIICILNSVLFLAVFFSAKIINSVGNFVLLLIAIFGWRKISILFVSPFIISLTVKISSKIFTDKGNFRFVFVAIMSESDFVKAEVSYSALVYSLFGPVQYQIFQVEKL